MEKGIGHLPQAIVDIAVISDVKNGRKIQLPESFRNEKWIGIFDENKKVYAVYQPAENHFYQPVRVFISMNEAED